MITKEEKKELERLKKQSNEPKDEEKITPLIRNGIQLKFVIPKKFADILGLDEDKNKVKVTLKKKEKKLLMEVIDA